MLATPSVMGWMVSQTFCVVCLPPAWIPVVLEHPSKWVSSWVPDSQKSFLPWNFLWEAISQYHKEIKKSVVHQKRAGAAACVKFPQQRPIPPLALMHLQMHSYSHWKKHFLVVSLAYLIFCFVIPLPIEVTHNSFGKLNCSLQFYSFSTQSFLSAHVLKLQQRAVTAHWWKWSCSGLLQPSVADFPLSDPPCQTDVTQLWIMCVEQRGTEVCA